MLYYEFKKLKIFIYKHFLFLPELLEIIRIISHSIILSFLAIHFSFKLKKKKKKLSDTTFMKSITFGYRKKYKY